jgi:hypothetical protein
MYHAKLHSADRREPKPFDEWWRQGVLDDRQGTIFTREGLVLALAHKDGGAHVDPDLDEAYAALSRGNSLGYEFYAGEVRLRPESPVPANVRQVAFELQVTLEDQLSNLLTEREEIDDAQPGVTLFATPPFTAEGPVP